MHEPVDEVLDTWWFWAKADRPHLGSPKRSPMFRDCVPEKGNIYDQVDYAESLRRRMVGQDVQKILDDMPDTKLRVAIELRTAKRCGQKCSNLYMTQEEAQERWIAGKPAIIKKFQQYGLLEEE